MLPTILPKPTSKNLGRPRKTTTALSKQEVKGLIAKPAEKPLLAHKTVQEMESTKDQLITMVANVLFQEAVYLALFASPHPLAPLGWNRRLRPFLVCDFARSFVRSFGFLQPDQK